MASGVNGLSVGRGSLAEPVTVQAASAAHRPVQRAEPLPFRARRWVGPLLWLGDIAAMESALFLGWLLREGLTPWLGGALRPGQYADLAVGLAGLPLAFALVGLYPGYGTAGVERLRRRVYTVTALFALLIVWQYLVLKGDTSRGVLLLTFAFAFILGPLVEAGLRRLLLARGMWGMPVAVIGATEMGARLVRVLRQEPELGYVPVAVLDDRREQWGRSLERVPVAGPLGHARQLGRRVGVALLAMPELTATRQARLCARLPFPKVVLVPNLMGMASLWVRSRDLGGVVGLEVRKNLVERRNWLLKRSVDYTLGVPLFLASLPLLAIFGVWIKLTSPRGPIFYRQRRVGFGGRSIRVWKLRTMQPDADGRLHDCLAENVEAHEQWRRYRKMRRDPRVLPGVGRVLRRTSLDELPQLWNVLRGEMSLVGPRPFPHDHLERFTPGFRALRRRVQPGLTGLWQVTSRSDGDTAVQEVLDTYYIRNWSLWLDVYILSRTFGAVISGRGAY